MFQNKNNQTTDGGKTNLSQERDLPIEDLPVHTMKKDLEAIKNPELAKAEIEYQESATGSRPINREALTEAQKGSPFLDFSTPKKVTPDEVETRIEPIKSAILDSRIKITETASQPEKPAASFGSSAPIFKKPIPKQTSPVPNSEKPPFDSKKDSPQPEQHPHHINFGKVFTGAAAILIIIIITGGGYYFWTTRQSAPEIVVTPPIIEPEPTPEPKPIAKFSTDKPNILTIDITTATSATIKELLQNTAKNVAEEKIKLPVEFTVAGVDGKAIAFKDFAKISGITLSPALITNLSDTFSLFIYNDKTVTRGGITINSENPIKLKGLLALEEKTLVKNITKSIVPTFLASTPAFALKAFASSNYNGIAIRYINITSPEDWSADYAIYGNKLVIGTTKMTLRSIVDYLKPELE